MSAVEDYLPEYFGPITNRDAEELAKAYGFIGAEVLAASLPEKARVLDLGAGASSLGFEIAKLRSDIKWVNADIRYFPGDPAWEGYKSPDGFNYMRRNAPNNLTFQAANLFGINNVFPERSFDRIFSYMMFMHAFTDNFPQAALAVHETIKLAKPGAKVSIGPVYKRPLLRTMLSPNRQSIASVNQDEYDRDINAISTIDIIAPETDRQVRQLTSIVTPLIGSPSRSSQT